MGKLSDLFNDCIRYSENIEMFDKISCDMCRYFD